MIIYKYLFNRFILGFIVSLIVLTSIEIFFSFTAELKHLNVGSYNALMITKYIILNIPESLEIMFPYAILIGSMLSLGAMSSDMEFVSMQSAGISISKIITIILIQAFLLSSVFYYVTDHLVPKYSNKAEMKKNFALNKKLIFNKNGVWFKDKNTFIKISQIYSDKKISGILVYSYDDDNSLSSIKNIGTADFIDNKWHLKEINETVINDSLITKKYTKTEYADILIDKKLINIKTHKPSSLSLADVSQNINYLIRNNLDPNVQKKIYWEKLFMPLSTVIMLFLSMPFIFGRHRSSNLSKRLVLGVFIGIGFFVITSILPNLGMILGIMPFISVLLPHILFLVLGKYLLDYQLKDGIG
ncbi:LPS export ABC transporter permease LptG [Gammaproteobacteria bacterium]|nr:LPS export ABC transporter permease LptG [Gammaproteobacteria bacterium]